MLLTEKVHHNILNNKSMAVINTKCVICNDAEKILAIRNVKVSIKWVTVSIPNLFGDSLL